LPCDTRLKPRQTITERKAEVLATVESVVKALVSGRVRAIVGPQGAIAFAGLSEAERNGVTDACMYRRIMSGGTQSAKLAVAKAEQLAGRSVNRASVAQGVHSHDHGQSWHDHKG
jgi:hypothetical protein